MFEIEDSFGVVFSTTALLQNVPRAVQAWGLSIPGEADGTYKLLYNDYTVLVFGTHSIYQREKVWHSLCCAHVYFVRHVRGELDLDKVRVVLCPLQTLVWYGRAKAWVTNQGSVPIRRPVQDMYGCFALSNSRAKLFFFFEGLGGTMF